MCAGEFDGRGEFEVVVDGAFLDHGGVLGLAVECLEESGFVFVSAGDYAAVVGFGDEVFAGEVDAE